MMLSSAFSEAEFDKDAGILSVSRSTLYWRLIEVGRAMGACSSVSDATLDSIDQRVKVDHPNDGEVMMARHLARICVRIT